MDTPAIPMPRDPREQAILQKLQLIRDRLLLLKQDRTNYIRTQDVMPLFDETMDQVKELTVVRAETGYKEENRCMSLNQIANNYRGTNNDFLSG
jgi:hypothetical protein